MQSGHEEATIVSQMTDHLSLAYAFAADYPMVGQFYCSRDGYVSEALSLELTILKLVRRALRGLIGGQVPYESVSSSTFLDAMLGAIFGSWLPRPELNLGITQRQASGTPGTLELHGSISVPALLCRFLVAKLAGETSLGGRAIHVLTWSLASMSVL